MRKLVPALILTFVLVPAVVAAKNRPAKIKPGNFKIQKVKKTKSKTHNHVVKH
jgi:hypothetical protein